MYTREKRAIWRHAINTKVAIGGIAAFVLIVALIVASFWIGQVLVYIFIIFAALFSLISFALLSYAALQIIQLVQEVRGEVNTLVGSARETMTEVQGTARFMSDNVVRPVSQAIGFLSAARATARAFTEPLYKRRG
jgi:hypothetical protein